MEKYPGFGMRERQDFFHSYVTPREFKKGARDIPFGEGAKRLFVDGSIGNDHNDGETWKTSLKTIQHSIDVAESWARIYVKAGTYVENVTIPGQAIELIGEKYDITKILPASGTGLVITGGHITVENFAIYAMTPVEPAVSLQGVLSRLYGILIDGIDGSYGLHTKGATYAELEKILMGSITLSRCIYGESGSYVKIKHVRLTTLRPGGYGMYMDGVHHWGVFTNQIALNANGIYLSASSYDNVIYHNNLVSNTVQVADAGLRNNLFENHYDDHTVDTNNDNLCDIPYSFITGRDYTPLANLGSWDQLTTGFKTSFRRKTGNQTTQPATDANGTTWVDLKTITPATSDLELHRIQMTVAGAWAGTPKYRIIIGSGKVYPFGADKNIASGVLETLVFPINVQINETVKVQFRSDNAGDGAGETVALDQLDYSEVV